MLIFNQIIMSALTPHPPPDIGLLYDPSRDSARGTGRPPAAILTGRVVVPPIPGTQGELGEGSMGWEGVTDQALQ